MLYQRLIAAFALILLVLVALFYLPKNSFCIVVILIGGLAAYEWTQFINLNKMKLRVIASSVFTLILLGVYFFLSPAEFHTLLITLISIAPFWWIIACILVVSYPKSATFWRNSRGLKTLFGLLSILPFCAGVILLRFYQYEINPNNGVLLLLFVFCLVWSADSGAYAIGRLLGKHKFIPHVSPNKTIEGAIGGIIATLIVSSLFVFFNLFPCELSLFSLLKITLLVAIVSILGDLSESMFKREANIKDSGILIPGHGGILDRIDSLLSAIPVFACFVLNF